jgi:hypothetical protein
VNLANAVGDTASTLRPWRFRRVVQLLADHDAALSVKNARTDAVGALDATDTAASGTMDLRKPATP